MDNQKTHHRRRQLRPSLDALESLHLLSGMAHLVAAHPVAEVHAEATKATKTPAAVAVVDLHGTIVAPVRLSSSSLVVAGSGNLGAVGTARINLRVSQNSSLPASTLVTKQGQITVSGVAGTLVESGDTLSPNGTRSDQASFAYTVVGGTGAYAHATGSGTLTETVTLSKSDKFTMILTFS